MQELDTVALTHDMPEHGLAAGDIGTIVMAHDPGHFEVEFVRGSGDTIAVLSLGSDAVRPMGRRDILHARVLG